MKALLKDKREGSTWRLCRENWGGRSEREKVATGGGWTNNCSSAMSAPSGRVWKQSQDVSSPDLGPNLSLWVQLFWHPLSPVCVYTLFSAQTKKQTKIWWEKVWKLTPSLTMAYHDIHSFWRRVGLDDAAAESENCSMWGREEHGLHLIKARH